MVASGVPKFQGRFLRLEHKIGQFSELKFGKLTYLHGKPEGLAPQAGVWGQQPPLNLGLKKAQRLATKVYPSPSVLPSSTDLGSTFV